MELDLRKQRILQAIVTDYIATAEPVGSHVLVERYQLGVRSATIRNEMAEMSDWGFLRQPHTSAGRVPSDRGYRFYVNRLMTLPIVHETEAHRVRLAMEASASEMETIVRRTCQLLADMTRLPAVATPPDAEQTELRQLFLTPVGANRTLLVLLFSTGQSENRLVDVPVSASAAVSLANALNARLTGLSVASLASAAEAALRSAAEPPGELASDRAIWQRLVSEVAAAARSLVSDTAVVVEGAHAVLEQPEFRDVERLAQFLRTVQERVSVLEMLGRALSSSSSGVAGGVQVTIGEEGGRPEFADYSVVSSPYYIAGREQGAIGVVGPTRMDYARASAAVSLMARTMTEVLTRLSVAP